MPSTTAGFLPPVLVVDSGATVTWRATDNIPHTATALPGYCFHSVYAMASPGRVTFRVHDGALYAAQPGKAEKACADALPLGGAAFLLHYECLYHPNMVGELVIRG